MKHGKRLAALVVIAAVAAGTAASTGTGSTARATTVKIALATKKNEFALIAPKAGKADTVTFVVKNGGRMEHEFVVLKTAIKAAKLPVVGGKAKELGKVGEIEEFKPGQTKRLKLTLKPGHYVLLCNVAGHYVAGQYADFTVK